MRKPILQPLFQAADGFRLVSGGAKGGMQYKRFANKLYWIFKQCVLMITPQKGLIG